VLEPCTAGRTPGVSQVAAMPDPSFVLKDTVGEMYFCNLRCFCVWSAQLATRPNLSAEDKTGEYTLTTPSGEEHHFVGIVDVARWATTTALNKEDRRMRFMLLISKVGWIP
jgi:hypothetical protein